MRTPRSRIGILIPLALGAPLLVSATPARPERPWTFLVYGAADNDADGPILEFLDGVREALDEDPGMELVLFIDRSERFSDDAALLGEDFNGARVYRLRRDSAERLDASSHFPELAAEGDVELDSADPATLGRFVAFGKSHFPAQRYGLLIYSHADGRSMCPDMESGRSMAIPALTDFVGEGASVDFLALELCNMAGIEIAYQWRPDNGGFSAQVLLAIPNAGPPLDWARAFARIRSAGHAGAEGAQLLDPSSMSAADFGRLVIEEGERGRRAMAAAVPELAEEMQHEAAGCFDLRTAADVKRALDAFAAAVARTDGRAALEALRGPDRECRMLNYVGGRLGSLPYVDLYDLCARAAQSEALAEQARAAAAKARDAVDRFVLASFGMDGLAGFQPGRSGVYVVFPDGTAKALTRAGFGRVWDLMDWYTPLESDGGEPYGRWSFLADGATPGNGVVETWFELLDSWYDEPDEAGGRNGYRD